MFVKKWLGQHFLVDKNLLDFIIRKADIKPNELILEIGTGTGLLTEFLAKNSTSVLTIEIDKTILNTAKQNLITFNNITYINENILQEDKIKNSVLDTIKEILKRDNYKAVKVVSNLPYSDATRIVVALLECRVKISKLIFMVQYEVVKRLCASVSDREYGSLTVLVNIFAHLRFIRKFPPDVFKPKPKVDSALIEIIPKKRLIKKIDEYELFKMFIKTIFSYRRKKTMSALKFSFKNVDWEAIEEIISQTKINLTKRPEELTVEDYVYLFYFLKSKNVFEDSRKI